MIPLWQAFLVFCAGAVAGWFIHVKYLAFKKEEESETDQEYLDRKAVEKAKETAKKLLEGL